MKRRTPTDPSLPARHERQLPSIAQLRSLIAIAALGSFGKAADALQTSQSTLSYQIDQLEEQLGVLLVNRTRRGVTLTEAGEAILARSQDVLEGLAAIRSEAATHATSEAGHVTLGVQAAMQVLAPPVVLAYQARYPEVRLSVREANAQTIREWLADERIHIGVLWDVAEDDRMTCITLGEADICLVGAAAARRPPAGELSVADLHDVPLALPTPANSGRRRMDKVFEDHDVLPVAAFNSDSLYTTKELVRRGAACALLPRVTVSAEIAAGEWWAVKVRELCAGETVRLMKLKDRHLSPAGLALQKVIVEQFARLAKPA